VAEPSDKLRHLLTSLGVLEPDDQLIALDSLKLVGIIMALEEAFSIEFEGRFRPEDFVSLATVRAQIARVRAATAPRRGKTPALGLPVLGIVPVRADVSSSPTTPHQQLFWYTERSAEAVAPYLQMDIVLRGPLARDALSRSLTTLVAAHSIFRTAYREIDGSLLQIVLDTDRTPELGLVDHSSLAEPERADALARNLDELAGAIDVAHGRVLHAGLVRFAPDHHVLQLVVHHIATDGAAIATLVRRLFALYGDAARGMALRDMPSLQLVDYTEALVRWRDTPGGQAASAYWRERMSDVVPVDVACDLPRAAIDAARDAAPLGIVGSALYTHERSELSREAAGAIAKLARAESTTTAVVHLAALCWMLHGETRQTDLCIEAVTSMRGAHPNLRDIQGMLTTWIIYRVNLAGCTMFGDAVRATRTAVAEAQEHPIIPDYYKLVPHTVRRVVFNYVPPPPWKPLVSAGELQLAVRAEVSQHIKRPWDLHVNVFDGPVPRIRWSGNEHVFTQGRLSALLQRYLEILVAVGTA
jgi:acyl carrier protein